MEGACCVYFLDLGGTLLGGAEVGGEMGGVWSRGCDTSATNDATAGGGALKGATFFNVAGTPSQDRPTLIAPTDVFRFPSTADGEDGSSELTRAEAYFYGFLRTRRAGCDDCIAGSRRMRLEGLEPAADESVRCRTWKVTRGENWSGKELLVASSWVRAAAETLDVR